MSTFPFGLAIPSLSSNGLFLTMHHYPLRGLLKKVLLLAGLEPANAVGSLIDTKMILVLPCGVREVMAG